MDMKARRLLIAALILCLVLLCSGCRRTRTAGGIRTDDEVQTGSGDAAHSKEPDTGTAESAADGNTDGAEADMTGRNDGRTQENPDSPRKEYDENAPALIIQGTDHLLNTSGEGEGASRVNDGPREKADRLNSRAEETAEQKVSSPDAERQAVSEDAEEAESAYVYYTVLLRDRTESMFECQRTYVYWETARDRVTIYKTAPEHALLLSAGAYDVSARLLPENLEVTDGWVARKNPGVIVKIVDGSVLGSGVHSTGAARSVRQSLMSRPDWSGMDAVRSGRVVLLSEELLGAPYLQTAAALIIAKACSPDLFRDVDPDKALDMLSEEAVGTLPTGILYDLGKEE